MLERDVYDVDTFLDRSRALAERIKAAKKNMKNAVHYNAVTAFGVDGGGGQNVQNGGGAGLQLREIGLLFTHDKAF